MGNVFEDYIKQETERMERMARQPEMMRSNDYRYGHRFIIVKDEPKNIEKFKNLIKDANLPDDVTIYYNEPYYYDLIEDGVHTRAKIERERKRQQALENPKVWQEVEDIETKEQLIEYLMDCWYTSNHTNVWEYSSDLEVDDKELTETTRELDRKIKELL